MMPLKCVPLLPGMFGSENTLDLKGMYRRRKQDNWGNPQLDSEGREQWDVVGGLPMRRHQDWVNKGFEYITLADEQSLVDAAPILRSAHVDWREFANQEPRSRSPFNIELYLEDNRSNRERDLTALREMVKAHGYDAVLSIKQQDNPQFRMPADIERPTDTPRRGRPPKTAEVSA